MQTEMQLGEVSNAGADQSEVRAARDSPARVEHAGVRLSGETEMKVSKRRQVDQCPCNRGLKVLWGREVLSEGPPTKVQDQRVFERYVEKNALE